MRCLAFDLGASSGKLFVGSLISDRLKLEPIYTFPNVISTFSGGLYWDFFHILGQMNLGIKAACAKEKIDTFGIDSFNNDFSLISSSGELLLPVRCYRDKRTEALSEEIYKKISPRTLYFATGNQLAPFNTFMQLAAMSLSGQGHIFDSVDSLLLLPDLLGFSITGIRHAEYTAAAETQFLRPETQSWLYEILETIGIPSRILPPICFPGTRIGPSMHAYCVDNNVHPFEYIAVCQHDTASAFLAAPVEKDVAYLSSGTWSLVGIEVPDPIITEETFRYNIANEGGYSGHHRLIKNIMGFWILQELLREYAAEGRPMNFTDVQELAQTSKPFQFLFDPNASIFLQPGHMREKIRQACLAHSSNAPQTPGEFFRCVYECLALRYRFAVELLERISGKEVRSINILGGGSRDAFGCQCTANATGHPVIAGPADATAIGNILVQMIALKEVANVSEGRALVMRSFEPAFYRPKDSEAWDEQYYHFLSLYERS